jgi:hypothetical protein
LGLGTKLFVTFNVAAIAAEGAFIDYEHQGYEPNNVIHHNICASTIEHAGRLACNSPTTPSSHEVFGSMDTRGVVAFAAGCIMFSVINLIAVGVGFGRSKK